MKKIIEIKQKYEEGFLPSLKRRFESGKKLFMGLFTTPLVDIDNVQEITGLSPKAANDLVDWFVDQGILIETTGKKRNRLFFFREYIELFK